MFWPCFGEGGSKDRGAEVSDAPMPAGATPHVRPRPRTERSMTDLTIVEDSENI